jgi:hypothetical protein
MRIIYNNQIPNATITAETENANYPVANIHDSRLTRVYRTTSLIDQEIEFEFASAIAASYVVIKNHNFSNTAIVKFQATNLSDSNGPIWTTLVVDVTLNIDSAGMIHYFSEQSALYWRLMVHDPENADGYIKIGLLYLANYLQLPGMKRDQKLSDNTTAKSKTSFSGQTHGNDGYDFKADTINLINISRAKRASIQTMFGVVKNYKPIILLIWEDDLDMEPFIYCIIDQKKLEWAKADSEILPWNTSIKFKETF